MAELTTDDTEFDPIEEAMLDEAAKERTYHGTGISRHCGGWC